MTCGLMIFVLALACSADAIDLIKAKQQLTQEPVPVVDLMSAQPQPVPQMNVVTDAVQALQASESVASPPVLTALQQQPVPQMNVVTDAVQALQASQPQTPPAASLAAPTVPAAAAAPPSLIASQPPVPNAAAQMAPQPPAPAASAVAPATSHLQVKNVTKLAFGQISDLGSEFHQLRELDQAHIKQLGIDIHLREHLEQQLHDATERLQRDNAELAQGTTGIATSFPSNEASLAQKISGDASAALVQAQSAKTTAETDQIAVATARDVKTLTDDMNALQARDANEVKALRGNAETRSALSAQIAKEREELMADSGGLAANLGEIRDLVAPSSNTAPASNTAPDSGPNGAVPSSEALVQQEAPAAAAQDTSAGAAQMPQEASIAVDVAFTTAGPEAAVGNSWLR